LNWLGRAVAAIAGWPPLRLAARSGVFAAIAMCDVWAAVIAT
jgi:hypothetical protein